MVLLLLLLLMSQVVGPAKIGVVLLLLANYRPTAVAVLVVAHSRGVVISSRHAGKIRAGSTDGRPASHVTRRRKRIDKLIGTHGNVDISFLFAFAGKLGLKRV